MDEKQINTVNIINYTGKEWIKTCDIGIKTEVKKAKK